MKIPVRLLHRRLQRIADRRPPDVVIGGADHPYMRRWWLIPRNRWFNVYLHHFLRSDDDRALHDHPWWNVSLLLKGRYIEVVLGPHGEIMKWRDEGQLVGRRAEAAHRIKLMYSIVIADDIVRLPERPVWTLFITGPKIRDWGFHCPKRWVPWQEFTTPDGSEVGKGCGE